MRIFIQTPTGKKFPLEVESSDTIDHVKGLIQEKEGICRLEQMLTVGGRELEDSKTLANYYFKFESTIYLMYKLEGGMRLHIKTTPGNPFTIWVWTQNPTINDLKAEIEVRMGIPVNEQRLIFSGKVLEYGRCSIRDCGIQADSIIRLVRFPDADKVVDNAAVEARKKAELSKDKGTGNQGETESELPKGSGSKRAREDSSSTTLSHSKSVMSSCGANRVPGIESFWDEEDFGLAWRRSQSLISPYDTSRFESKSPHMLIESVASESVRTLNIMAFLEGQLNEYQDKLGEAKEEVERLSKRNAYVEDSLHKEKECVKKVMQELDVEVSTGTSFLQSEDGRRHIATLKRQAAKSAVDEFKKSAAFKELVMDDAMRVYNDAVTKCQMLLRNSGRVSKDIIQLIGPQAEEELQKNDEDEMEEGGDDE